MEISNRTFKLEPKTSNNFIEPFILRLKFSFSQPIALSLRKTWAPLQKEITKPNKILFIRLENSFIKRGLINNVFSIGSYTDLNFQSFCYSIRNNITEKTYLWLQFEQSNLRVGRVQHFCNWGREEGATIVKSPIPSGLCPSHLCLPETCHFR